MKRKAETEGNHTKRPCIAATFQSFVDNFERQANMINEDLDTIDDNVEALHARLTRIEKVAKEQNQTILSLSRRLFAMEQNHGPCAIRLLECVSDIHRLRSERVFDVIPSTLLLDAPSLDNRLLLDAEFGDEYQGDLSPIYD